MMTDQNDAPTPDTKSTVKKATTKKATAKKATAKKATAKKATAKKATAKKATAKKATAKKATAKKAAAKKATAKKATAKKATAKKAAAKKATAKKATAKKATAKKATAKKATAQEAVAHEPSDATPDASAPQKEAASAPEASASSLPEAAGNNVSEAATVQTSNAATAGENNNRRVRRRRTATQAVPSRSEEAAKREPRRRRRGPKSGNTNGAAAVGATGSRRVYRQDYPGAGAIPAPPPEPTAEELQAAKVKEAAEQNKITLILHPPPKHLKRKGKKKRFKSAKEALKARSAQNQKKRGNKGAKSAPKTAVEIKPEWLTLVGDEAVEALKQAGEPLVRAWLKQNNAEAILACAHASSITGPARKAAKRAIGVLKSRGLDVEAPKRPKFQLQPETHEVLACFIPPDASGVTFYSISQRQPSGRYKVADIMVRDQLGIVHASSGELPGKQIRKWKSRVREQFGAMPIEVSLDWARYRIAEGLRKNEESRQVVPLGFASCASLIEPVPNGTPEHPVADLLQTEQTEQQLKDCTGASRELHQEPEFANWLPDKGALDELFAKVGARVGEENSGDQELVNKILDEEMASATDRFFTPELREVLVGRMHDSAISVRKRKGDEAALQVIAVTQAIANAGLITSPPSEIPFLLSFFQKGVAFAIQRNQGRLQVPVAG